MRPRGTPRFRWTESGLRPPTSQRFTPRLANAARFQRHAPGDRWFVDETYFNVNGVWHYVDRAVDQHGQVIDVLVGGSRLPVVMLDSIGQAADELQRWLQPGSRLPTRSEIKTGGPASCEDGLLPAETSLGISHQPLQLTNLLGARCGLRVRE